MLTTTGSGVVALTNASGNTYSGGTSVTGTSTLYVSNTGNSATGAGALSVARGAELAGTGIINATTGSITLGGTSGSGVAKVYVGQAVGGDTGTTSNLTLKSTSGMSITNTALTFNLNTASVGGSGAPSLGNGGTGASGSGNELIVGTTGVTFGTGVTLQLNLQGSTIIAPNTPYVLFAGTGTGSGLNNSLYSGLTSGGTDSQGHIIIEGLTLSFGGSQPPSWYANSYLFLNTVGGVDDIEVEVVPEPGTWAMIIAGFGMLLGIQRLRRRTTV
jgi:fibronectin-binding autotransporter adhesin